MKTLVSKKRDLAVCAVLSLLAHLAALYAAGRTGSFHFATPLAAAVAVELVGEKAKPAAEAPVQREERGGAPGRVSYRATARTAGEGASEAAAPLLPALPDPARMTPPVPEEAKAIDAVKGAAADAGAEMPASTQLKAASREPAEPAGPNRERLVYQISITGIPLGSAVLEARVDGGELVITSTIRSNPVAAAFYPVDDTARTRVVGDRYVIARIRQQEGNYRSEAGFTLCFKERKVFWMDLLTKETVTEPLQDEQARDLLSAFYLLRRAPLQVGKPVQLHVFDSNRTLVTPVEVLRKERVRARGLGEKAAFVVRSDLQTAGLFRKTGDLLAWLTDDEYRVPVRLETTTPLGRVTAELVSAEVEPDPSHPAASSVSASAQAPPGTR